MTVRVAKGQHRRVHLRPTRVRQGRSGTSEQPKLPRYRREATVQFLLRHGPAHHRSGFRHSVHRGMGHQDRPLQKPPLGPPLYGIG